MSNLGLYDLAAAINQKDNDPTSDLKLRIGTVSTVEAGSCTVTIGGVLVPGVKHYDNLSLRPGDIVDVLLDGPSPRVIGIHGAGHGTRRIGYQAAPNGGNVSVTLTTTQQDISYLGIACGKVAASRLIRVTFKIWAAGGTQREVYFPLQISEDTGGTRATVDEYRWVVVADNGPSPFGQFTFVTTQAYTNLCCYVRGQCLSGTVTLMMSSGDTSKNQHSFILVEDLGHPAATNLDP